MNKQFTKILALVLILACLLGTTALVAGAGLSKANAGETPFVWNLEEQYCRLATVENLVTAQIGDKMLETAVYVTYPSGKTVNGKSFHLEEAGLYTVKATAIHEDKVYTENKQFLVYTPVFEVEGGSAVYRNHPYTEITGEENPVSSVNGVLVSIPEGSKLVVTQPLDISNHSRSEALLKFHVVSAEKGVKDFSFLRFTFTDMADPNNKLVFTCLNQWQVANNIRNDMNWWHAGATGQNLVGYQNDQGQDKVWVNSTWGTGGIGAFHMCPWKDDSYLITDCFGIWMDTDLKVYAGRGQNYICDLNDPKFHTNLWEGFKSNNVLLTIEAEQYEGSNPAQLFITEMMGVDLQVSNRYDTTAPVITVNSAPYAENALPDACVGKPYPVFSATAKDPDLAPANVKLEVYGGVYPDSSYLVRVKDGAFTPDIPGTYTLKYTATDSWGNTSVKLAYVYARNAETPLTLNLGDKVVNGKVGEKFILPAGEVTGNFGNAKIDIQVSFGGVEIANNGSFIPYKEGTYQVIYTVTDYIGQQTQETYDVQIAKADTAVFGDIPVVNRYMLLEMPNYIPVIDAFNYVTADGARILADTYAQDASGIHKVEGRSFTPAAGTTEVLIWWEATINGKTVKTAQLTVPTVSAKNELGYQLDKFFVGGVESVATKNNVALSPLYEGATATWATPILAEGFSLVFSADKMGICTVLLEDYENPDQKLEIVINTATNIAVVNGTRNYQLTLSGSNYSLQYDPFTNTISDGNTKLVPLDAEGNTFSGFSSGKVYMTMSFEKLQTGASAKIASLNAHYLNERTFDLLKPGVTVLGETGGFFTVGDTAIVYKGATADVVSPFCTFYVTVYDPDGEIVVNKDGERMEKIYPDRDFVIELTKVGAYIVQFYSEDADGNKEKNISYALNVLDLVAPEMTDPATPIPETAKVGDKLRIPGVTATDAVDGELDVIVYLVTPDLEVRTVTTSSVEFTQTGMYVLKYYAFDTTGNSEILEYTVFVS